MSKPDDEQMYALLESLALDDGTPLGDASPTALAADLDEQLHKLKAMQMFLRFCPENAITVRDGYRLARERADMVDGAILARTNLLEVICEEELRSEIGALSEEERTMIEARADEMLARWEEGDERIRSSMLQKRLGQLSSANRRIEQHETLHGNQVWWED